MSQDTPRKSSLVENDNKIEKVKDNKIKILFLLLLNSSLDFYTDGTDWFNTKTRRINKCCEKLSRRSDKS